MALKAVGAAPSGNTDLVTKGYVDPRTRQSGGIVEMGSSASGGSASVSVAPATYFLRSSTLGQMTDFSLTLPSGQTLATTITIVCLTPITTLSIESDSGSSTFSDIPMSGVLEYVFEPSIPLWYCTHVPAMRGTQNGVFTVTPITEAEYSALSPADPNTLYFITD